MLLSDSQRLRLTSVMIQESNGSQTITDQNDLRNFFSKKVRVQIAINSHESELNLHCSEGSPSLPNEVVPNLKTCRQLVVRVNRMDAHEILNIKKRVEAEASKNKIGSGFFIFFVLFFPLFLLFHR